MYQNKILYRCPAKMVCIFTILFCGRVLTENLNHRALFAFPKIFSCDVENDAERIKLQNDVRANGNGVYIIISRQNLLIS